MLWKQLVTVGDVGLKDVLKNVTNPKLPCRAWDPGGVEGLL